ncbi:unannotated protein [freshwater metagenome]|uniref:Unannotated protein n=1 Tax=freshwater metagenome TaxID=449393 RepID=A0A6J6X6U2_9ZZZZ
MHEVGDDVSGAGDEEPNHQSQDGRTSRRANWHFAGSVQQVVQFLVTRELALKCGPGVGNSEDDAGQNQRRERYFPGNRVAEIIRLPGRRNTEGTVQETHVPVRLHGVGNLRSVVRTEEPDWVDLHECTQQRRYTGHDEEIAGGLAHEHGEHWGADHILFGATRPRELRVLLSHQQEQVSPNHRHDDAGNQQYVEDEESRNHRGTGEVSAEDKEGEIRTNDGDRFQNRIGDSKTSTRDQVVGKRVAQESVHDAQGQQRGAD